MKLITELVHDTLQNNPDVRSVLAVSSANRLSPITDGFDVLLLIVTGRQSLVHHTIHYIREHTSIQERWLDEAAIERWIVSGENRAIIQWIVEGAICIDRDDYLLGLRKRLLAFPVAMRNQKLFIEFSLFLKTYMQAKKYVKDGHILDAYSCILESLIHWARIAIVEAGFHPEITVWQQLKKINPGIYKLFEELTENGETMEQRVQLVLLACEFHVLSKMETCCRLLLDVLGSREEPFAPNELLVHPDIQQVHVHINLALVLKKLVSRGLVREQFKLMDDAGAAETLTVQYTLETL